MRRPGITHTACILALLSSLPLTATALAGQCEQRNSLTREAELRALLEEQQSSVMAWRTAWMTVLGLSTVGQLAIADRLSHEGKRAVAAIGAGKAFIGFLSLIVVPVQIEIPVDTDDPCADVAALEDALARAAESERRGRAWWKHGGGLALNGAGLLLGGFVYDYWHGALINAGIGLAVGQLITWTQPMEAADAPTFDVTPVIAPGYAGVAITF